MKTSLDMSDEEAAEIWRVADKTQPDLDQGTPVTRCRLKNPWIFSIASDVCMILSIHRFSSVTRRAG